MFPASLHCTVNAKYKPCTTKNKGTPETSQETGWESKSKMLHKKDTQKDDNVGFHNELPLAASVNVMLNTKTETNENTKRTLYTTKHVQKIHLKFSWVVFDIS